MKKGFTLAEVLITLSIIGIIASITLPALNQNASKSKIGPALAKFVSTMENSINTWMVKNETTSIVAGNIQQVNGTFKTQIHTVGDLNDFLNALDIDWVTPTDDMLSKYSLDTSKLNTLGINFKNNNAKKPKDYNVRLMKDGTVVLFDKVLIESRNNGDLLTPNKPSGYLGNVIYDINGFKEPNKLASDVFVFELYSDGSLIAVGSAEYDQKYNTTSTCEPNSNTPGKQMNCTGAIADNGWKVPW